MAGDLKQKTISGILWSGVQKFGSLAISFIANIVLARLLTPDDFGCIGMLAIFIVLSQTFIDGGFGAALVQKKNPTEEDYSTIFYWNIIVAVLLYALLFVTAPLIADFYRIPLLTDILRVQGISLIISSLYIIQSNRLVKQLNFKTLSIVTIIATLAGTFIAIIMAYRGWGVWSLVAKEMITVLVTVVLLWYLCKWRPLLRFSFVSLKSLFSFGSMILLASLINRLYENIQGLIIGRAFSAKDLGYYTQAKKIEEIPVTSFSDMITQVTFPVYASIADKKDEVKRILRKNIKVINYISFGVMSLLIVIATPLFLFIFSEKWLESVPLFQILCISGMIIPLNNANVQLLKALGKGKMFLRLQFVKRTIGIIVIAISIKWGLIAMMWAITLSNYLSYILNVYCTKKALRYTFMEQLGDILPNLFFVFMIVFGFYEISSLDIISIPIIQIFVVSILFVSLYVGVGWLLKFEGALTLFQIIREKIKFNR